MKKQLGASFLLAGTAIGSGMLSLPMVLAKFGIFNSVLIMFAFAVLTYFSALIRADLNIQSNPDASLKDVGIFFHCPKTGTLGDILLKLLHFSFSKIMFCRIITFYTLHIIPKFAKNTNLCNYIIKKI